MPLQRAVDWTAKSSFEKEENEAPVVGEAELLDAAALQGLVHSLPDHGFGALALVYGTAFKIIGLDNKAQAGGIGVKAVEVALDVVFRLGGGGVEEHVLHKAAHLYLWLLLLDLVEGQLHGCHRHGAEDKTVVAVGELAVSLQETEVPGGLPAVLHGEDDVILAFPAIEDGVENAFVSVSRSPQCH